MTNSVYPVIPPIPYGENICQEETRDYPVRPHVEVVLAVQEWMGASMHMTTGKGKVRVGQTGDTYFVKENNELQDLDVSFCVHKLVYLCADVATNRNLPQQVYVPGRGNKDSKTLTFIFS